MPEPIDGYAEWLGVTTSARPLNHYQLLGLLEFESDRPKILAAAEAALAKVRPFRESPRADECLRILDELSMAKLILGDGARKGQYDGQLRSKLATRPTASTPRLAQAPSAASPNPPATQPASSLPGQSPAALRPLAPGPTQPSAAQPAQKSPVNEFALPPTKSPAARPTASGPASKPAAATGGTANSGPTNPLRPMPLRPISLASLGYPATETNDAPQQPLAVQPQADQPAYQQPAYQQPVYQEPVEQPMATQPPTRLDRLPPLHEGMVSGAMIPDAAENAAAAFARIGEPVANLPAADVALPAPGADGVIVRKSLRPVSLGIRTEPAPIAAPARKRANSETPESQRKMLIGGTIAAVVIIIGLIVLTSPKAPEPVAEKPPSKYLNPLGSDDEKTVPDEPDANEPAPKPKKTQKHRPVEPMDEEEAADEPKAVAKPKSKPDKPKSKPAPVVEEQPEPPVKPAVVSAPEPEMAPDPPGKPAMNKPPANEMASNDPADKPMTTKPAMSPPGDAPEGVPDADQVAAFGKGILKIRSALAGRNVDQAQAELTGAKSLALSAEQKLEFARVDSLVGYVAGFWNAVRESMKGLQATDELKIGNTTVTVVEADMDGITLHRPGRNDKYTIANMPGGIAFMLAERWYDKSNPANKIYLGAFHAVDPSGDLGEARRLWDGATKSGASAEDLMPLLNLPPVKPSAGPSSGGEDKPDKADKAERIALLKAEQAFNKKYGPEVRAAGTAEKRLDLAAKLIEEFKLSGDATEQNILFRKACDLVNKVAVSNATSAAEAREAAQRAMSLLDQAVEEKRFDAAKLLQQAPVMAARKSQDDDLVKTATEHTKKLQETLRQADPSL